MHTIRIRQWFRAAPETVFRHFSDHEALGRLWPGRFVRIADGEDEADGLGSVREVRLPGGLHFREQVVEFRPPELIAYRMAPRLPGITHHYGVMRFRPEGSGTLLDYRIELDARLFAAPLLSGLIERSIKPGIRRLAADYERTGTNAGRAE
jgi:uncharacterized protein YndB with AHSA1/START domain